MKNVGSFSSQSLKLIIFVLSLFGLFYFPYSALADDINLTANVVSQVSPELSSDVASTNQTLADPAGHSILITVKLVDKNNQPLGGKLVQLSSTRGSADIIEATSKLLSSFDQPLTTVSYSDMAKDYTDSNGLATFRLTSFTSGSTEIKVVADNIVQLSSIKGISFEQLPFTMYMTVAVRFPFLNKDLNILSSSYNRDNLSELQRQSFAIVNPGVKIYISGWLFAIGCFIVLMLIILMIVVTISRVMIGRIKQDESTILKKISKSNDI